MRTLKNDVHMRGGEEAFKTAVIDCTFPVGAGAAGMVEALDRICDEVSEGRE